MKNAKILTVVLAMVVLLRLVSAANVGVVVTYPNGTDFKQCVGANTNSNGYEILNEANLNVGWSNHAEWGHSPCNINGVGLDVVGDSCKWSLGTTDYWSFSIVDGESWKYSATGWDAQGDSCWDRVYDYVRVRHDHYCAVQGDVLGFAYGPYGKEPTFYNYDNVCPNKLGIKELKVYVNGSRESSADEDGGRIKDVKPESVIKISIKFENLYTDDEGTEIRGIQLTGAIEGIDDGENIEEEASDFDLDAEEKETAELEFKIPLEVEDGSYDLILTIESKDENGIEHNHEITFELEVEKEKNEVIFKRAELSNDNLRCSRATELYATLVNVGEKEEDVTLTITNDALAISQKYTFKLSNDPFDDESSYSSSYPIIVNDSAAAGTYPLLVEASYSGKTQKTAVDLIVEDCERTGEVKTSTLTGQTEKQTESQAVTAAAIAEQPAEQPAASAATSSKISSTKIMMSGIIAIEALVIIGGSLLAVKWIGKK